MCIYIYINMNNEIIQKNMNNEIVQKNINNEIVQKNKYNKYKQKYLLLKYNKYGDDNNEIIKYDMSNEIIYQNKYNKYKHKYLTLKYNLSGGDDIKSVIIFIINLLIKQIDNSDNIITLSSSIMTNIITMCNLFNDIIDIIKILNCIICNLQISKVIDNLKKIIIDSVLNNVKLSEIKSIDKNNPIFNKIILQIYLYIKNNLPCKEEVETLFISIESKFNDNIKIIINDFTNRGIKSITDIHSILNEKLELGNQTISEIVTEITHTCSNPHFNKIKDIVAINAQKTFDSITSFDLSQLPIFNGGEILNTNLFSSEHFKDFKKELNYDNLLIFIINIDCGDIVNIILKIMLIIIYIINYLTLNTFNNILDNITNLIIYILYFINKIKEYMNIQDIIKKTINDNLVNTITNIINTSLPTQNQNVKDKMNKIIPNIPVIFKFISLLLSPGMPSVSEIICTIK